MALSFYFFRFHHHFLALDCQFPLLPLLELEFIQPLELDNDKGVGGSSSSGGNDHSLIVVS
jgi:hypothetical protein